jgi:TIR domain
VTAAEPKLFISYRREETAGHAGRLYDAIAARFGERNVFMDVDMAPGLDFVDRITEAVADCDVLLVVIGPEWATLPDNRGQPRLSGPEDYVRLEVETALRNPAVTVIPVLVGGSRMPRADELPQSVRPLSRRNALELSDLRWRHDVGRLVGTLGEQLEGPDAVAAEPPPQPASPAAARRSRGGRLGALAAVLALGILAAGLALAGVFSGEDGGGRQAASRDSGTAALTTDDAVDVVGEYERLYEAKDVDGLRQLMDPAVMLDKGSSLELRGADEVTEEYGREFESFGDQDPVFEWDEETTDADEELFEVYGQYLISVGDDRREAGRFGFLMRSVGSELLITQICLRCPELRGSGRLRGS